MRVPFFLLSAAVLLSGCATIVNDPTIPVTLSFSDNSRGQCFLRNKRASYDVEIPGTHMIRRSDDPLQYDCKTRSGKRAVGNIQDSLEMDKMAASVIFWDFGITDSITDKARIYPSNFVIPVR